MNGTQEKSCGPLDLGLMGICWVSLINLVSLVGLVLTSWSLFKIAILVIFRLFFNFEGVDLRVGYSTFGYNSSFLLLKMTWFYDRLVQSRICCWWNYKDNKLHVSQCHSGPTDTSGGSQRVTKAGGVTRCLIPVTRDILCPGVTPQWSSAATTGAW